MASETKRPDTWMPLYIGDYLRDTSRLTTEGHGAYMLLIFDYWVSGQPLPDDDQQLAAITRLAPARWKALRPTISRFFQLGDGVWHHKRIDEELALAVGRIGKRSAAGTAGATARWGNRNANANGKRMANASEPQCDGIADVNAPSPSPEQEKPSLSGGQKEPATAQGKATKRRQQVPVDWLPDDAGREYARQEAGWTEARIEREVGRFRDFHRGKGNLFLDVSAGWRTWVRNGAERDAQRGAPPAATPPPDPASEDAVLRFALSEFVATRDDPKGRWFGRGHWPSNRGSPPGHAGCQIPLRLLAEFGLVPPETELAAQ